MRKILFIGMLCMGVGGHFLASAATVTAAPKAANHKKAQAKKHHTSDSEDSKGCKHFSHLFALSTMDSTFSVEDTDLQHVSAKVSVSGDVVTLAVSGFSFEIPETSLTPRDGFVYTLPYTNLPESTWHSQGMPYAVPCASNCTLYVFNDGSIVIGAPDFQPLMAGSYTVNDTTITYKLDKAHKVPKNFKISNKEATVAQYPQTNDLLDFYNNDFYKNAIAYTFSANPASDVTNPMNLNFYAVIGKEDDGKISFGPVKALYIPDNQPNYQRCIENTISINPKNKKNIVATSTFRNGNFSLPDPTFNARTFLRSYTFDGGETWTTDKMTGTERTAGYGLPESRGDPNGMFDEFGNYWITYMSTDNPAGTPPLKLVFAVSTDGGVTFNEVGDVDLNTFLDYPRLSFGGDGQGGKALWFSVDFVDDTGYVSDIVIGYIQVGGLGVYGSLNYDLATGLGKDVATNSVCYIQVPEITTTPEGDVYLLGTTQIYEGDNGNYTKVVVAKHTGGINNFTQFDTPTDAFISNVGGNDLNTAAYGKPVPFQPKRGVFPAGARGIDYDPIHKKLWICGPNIKPNNFSAELDTNPGAQYDMSIYAMYSEDGGKTWSPQIQVSDRDTLDRGLPSIKVNQKTGEKAFFWYDARDDLTGVSVKPFGAILK